MLAIFDDDADDVEANSSNETTSSTKITPRESEGPVQDDDGFHFSLDAKRRVSVTLFKGKVLSKLQCCAGMRGKIECIFK